MGRNCVFAGLGLLELAIGALVLALGVMLKRINIDNTDELDRDRLVLLPYGGLILLSGLFLVFAGIFASRCLIKWNMSMHLIAALFSIVCIALMAKHTPYDSDYDDGGLQHMNINKILSTEIGSMVLEFLLAAYMMCHGIVVLPAPESEDSPVPKPEPSVTIEPLYTAASTAQTPN